MCSLIMSPSKPASSASTANRTSCRRSRGDVSVQFSLRIRISFGGVILCIRQLFPEPFGLLPGLGWGQVGVHRIEPRTLELVGGRRERAALEEPADVVAVHAVDLRVGGGLLFQPQVLGVDRFL